MDYNHYEFCEEMARKLRAVGHTDERQRFFKASGGEWLADIEDRLSAVSGLVLVAVDSGELDTQGVGADALQDDWRFFVILAKATDNDHPDTVHAAMQDCRTLAVAVRNVLIRRYPRMMSRTTSIFPVGPLADNYYGVALEFTMQAFDNYAPDESLFISDEPEQEQTVSDETADDDAAEQTS